MTGMKEGAGEDPFADGTTTDDPDPVEADSESQTAAERTREQSNTETVERQQQSMTIPYKFRRDGVKDGRDRVPLFLRPETKRAERDALRELEERFDANVSLTDLREALVQAGLEHLDDVEEELEEWGYGMTFDEP
jgi:hypothetical protein